MQAGIITIGNEILSGKTVNTNASYLASALSLLGIETQQIVAVKDLAIHIAEALRLSIENNDIVIITGGLGPTSDDITKRTLGEFFASEWIINEQVLEDVKSFFAKRNLPLTEKNRLQALVPDNAKILRNLVGTAPGLWFEVGGKIAIALPGVPFEMKHIIEVEVLPRLKAIDKEFFVVHRTINTHGIGESFLSDKISHWEKNLNPSISLAYLPAVGIVKLRLTASGINKKVLEDAIEEQVSLLQEIIPEHIWGYDDETLEEICGKLLLQKKLTLCTVESCTGGAIANRIINVAGCSQYYRGSIVAYSNDVKTTLLGIPSEIINQNGAVSQQVVELMALQGCSTMQSDFCVATSGIAGPGGATPEKPVGTIWIAVAHGKKVVSQKYQFGDIRQTNIARTTVAALAKLHDCLK